MSRARIVASYLRTRARRLRTREALERHQAAGLRRLFHEVLPRSPFYARHLGDVRRPLAELPTIDKAVMMAELDTLNTAGIRRDEAMAIAIGNETSRRFGRMLGDVTVGLSSGTSGARGLFLASGAERDLYAGVMLAKLLPSPLLSTRRDRVALFLRSNSSLYESVGSRRIAFAYFDLLQELHVHVARLAALQPTLIFAPASVLRALAEAIRAGRLRVAPERIYAVAEVLDPIDERFVSEAFGQPVHQVYQATEGHLGQTCAHGTMHLNEDLLVVEPAWIDERRFTPIVTDLCRRTQPIIRYRLDDVLVARATPCPCGSPMRAIERIEGRADDVFLWPRTSGEGSRPVFSDYLRRAVLVGSASVREYGVRQVGPTSLELMVHAEPGHELSAYRAAEAGIAALAAELGCVAPQVRRIEAMPSAPGRKRKRIERAFVEAT